MVRMPLPAPCSRAKAAAADAMLNQPILINRPIVVTRKGVRLCRPSEAVLELLPAPIGRFVKEDGEVTIRIWWRPSTPLRFLTMRPKVQFGDVAASP